IPQTGPGILRQIFGPIASRVWPGRRPLMFRLLFVLTVGKLIAWPIRRRFRAFERAAQNPARTQAALLREILALQAGTQFGRDHSFATIKSIADYRKQVPVGPYEYVQPYIEKVQR